MPSVATVATASVANMAKAVPADVAKADVAKAVPAAATAVEHQSGSIRRQGLDSRATNQGNVLVR